MKFKAVFSDDRTITWEGQTREVVEALAAELARGATFEITEEE